MGNSALSLSTLFASFMALPDPVHSPDLTLHGDQLKITGKHTTRFQHIIDDLGVKVNGHKVGGIGFETKISNEEEEVTIVLPFEPKPGDVIIVDTAVHSFGSKKVTLRVE